jgi:hypothetical protein
LSVFGALLPPRGDAANRTEFKTDRIVVSTTAPKSQSNSRRSGVKGRNQLLEQLTKMIHLLSTEPSGPIRLKTADDLACGPIPGPATFGEADDLCPAIGGIDHTLDQTARLHVRHELPHRLLGHLIPVGQLTDP